MILDGLLQLLKTYLPLVLGVVYLYGYEKNKIENLVKFFVLRTILGLVEFVFIRLFLFQFWIIHYSMIPIYFYLTVYSYSYAAATYDHVIAPLLYFFIEYHAEVNLVVDKERNRIKTLENHGKIKVGELNELDSLSFFQRRVYKTFNVDNMYLLK